MAWNMAFAVGSSDRRTRLGMTAPRAESSKVPRPPDSAGQTNSADRGHDDGDGGLVAAPVDGVHDRPAEERPGEHRYQRGERDQADVKG
jgi:hypothetical protein